MTHMNQKRVNIKYEIILIILNKKLHGRAISKNLNIPLSTIQRNIKELFDKNIIDYEVQGKNNIYFIKKNLSARKWIINAENYKLLKLFKKNPIFEIIFSNILNKFSGLIVLFGSYANFSENNNSDIDIYLETNSKKIKESIEFLNNKINVKIGMFDKKSLLIQEIIENHIIINGVENYYQKIFEEINY
jgi:predicted nucleotidyltransferase